MLRIIHSLLSGPLRANTGARGSFYFGAFLTPKPMTISTQFCRKGDNNFSVLLCRSCCGENAFRCNTGVKRNQRGIKQITGYCYSTMTSKSLVAVEFQQNLPRFPVFEGKNIYSVLSHHVTGSYH